MQKLFFFTLLSLFFLSCKDDPKKATIHSTQTTSSYKKTNPVAQKIADRYGIVNWEKITTISFTFNVLKGKKPFSRSWSWNTKTNEVTLITLKDTINYNRNKIDSLSIKYDKAFINDKYWLLAPFNLVWDSGTTFSTTQNAIAPISKDTLSRLTISYNNNVGYTPGDAYDLFYDKNYLIKEWNFRKGNTEKISLSTTWEENKTLNQLTFATKHQDSTGLFNVFFTDITVQ